METSRNPMNSSSHMSCGRTMKHFRSTSSESIGSASMEVAEGCNSFAIFTKSMTLLVGLPRLSSSASYEAHASVSANDAGVNRFIVLFSCRIQLSVQV